MKVYLDTSVLIALADPLDMFHKQSMSFVSKLVKHKFQCMSSSPLLMELGKLVESKGTKRCLDIINSMEEFGIRLKNIDIEEVWELCEAYLHEDVLTKRHRLDLLHYASASLLGCTHLASWNSKQFNERISKKISSANVKEGLSRLIAGKPEYIMRQGNLG